MVLAPAHRPIESVSVIGLGRIGAPLAACLSARGLGVVGVDIDRAKVNAVNSGAAPNSEPGLEALIGRPAGALRATRSVHEAVLDSDATFLALPTPSAPDGSVSPRHVLTACAEVGDAMRSKMGFHLVVVVSTVMPGTTGGAVARAVADASGKRCGEEFAVCYVPEFVALGTAVHDFLAPDFVLIGEADPAAGYLLDALYLQVCDNDPPIVHTSLVAAELAKLAVNAFLATKITFANVLAQICDGLPGCDVDAVTSVVGLDSRVGKEYLTAATSFGGPCLPRDTVALGSLARDLGAPAGLADAAIQINSELLDRLVAQVEARLPAGGRVGVCGLAFKPGTDVVDESPGVILADRLAQAGVRVIAFDPVAMEPARALLGGAVELAGSLEECIACADLVVLSTPWEAFSQLDPSVLKGDGRALLDPWRIVAPPVSSTLYPVQ